MKKRSLALTVVAALALVMLAAAGSYAGTAPAEIKMAAPYEHTKTQVVFSHQKHLADYKIGCGECHHDDKGQPLNDLKDGDPVKSCFDCHNKPGELKGKKAKGLSKADKLAYHANALHDNCIGCHKEYNKDNNTKAAPQKCTDCHPKKK